MKQCANSNCILYTRLEELPDAYVKCPACGGVLVPADLTSRVLSSGHLRRSGLGASSLAYADDDTLAHGGYPSGPLAPDQAGYEYPGEYAYDGEEEKLDPSFAPSPQAVAGTRSKLAVVAAAAAFLTVCAMATLLVGTRFLPSTRLLSAPEATETALSWVRPAVNTPIPILPTSPSSGVTGPLPNVQEAPPPLPTPTYAPAPPLPSGAAPAQPPPSDLPPAVAPPVLDARMSVRLERGAPVGEATAYGTGDPFNLAVQANYGPGGVTSIVTRWYGPDNSLFYELRQSYTQPGIYYSGFTVRKDGPWLPGSYRVDIHTNDSPRPAASVSFQVLGP